MSKYTVENTLERFGRKTENFPAYAVVYDRTAIVMCHQKLNAELIADILNTDSEHEVFPLISLLESLLQNKYRLPIRGIASTAHEAYMIAENKRLEQAFVDAHIRFDGQWKEFSENGKEKI